MKLIFGIVLIFSFTTIFGQKKLDKDFIDKSLQFAESQIMRAVKENENKTLVPRSIKKDGTLSAVTTPDWTSGFFAGSLWYLFEYSGKSEIKTAADYWTKLLEKEQYNKTTHDLGFMMFCSYGNSLRLTKNEQLKSIIVQSSKSLISRYREKTQTIRSWDHGSWQYPVIIDNMMNLEMLFWATKETGDSTYYKISVNHANTTMKNHYRKDMSCYHVVDYDTITGIVINKQTCQGYSDESSWARGQAWGLYGYTLCYRETGNKIYMDMAEKIAEFLLNHPNLPKDKIPYWDYNAPDIPNAPRDVSSATVMCSALLELQKYTNPKKSKQYMEFCNTVLTNLATENYRAKAGENQNFVLLHSVGHLKVNSEVDVPLNYADYYYLESLLRYKNWILSKK